MASKGKGKNDDLKQEEILQAIVIADSFNVRFAPATDKKPRVLLPMVNVPILDYTLELLAINGIQETLVFCCHHANQIRAHLRDSKWTEGKSSMVVKTILSEGCGSVGEVLREVDSRSLIRGDFFLLFGDTICSMELKKLMAEHKERRERIKSCVMTATYKSVPPTSRMRCKEENVVMVTCPKTQRICHFQMQSFDTKIRVPNEVFLQHSDVELHSDLLDAQLYTCSPSVLHLFTDNFDFCTMEDFIKGLLISEEILGSTVHVNLKIGNYCARASNPYMYHVISQDILRAWTTPIDLKRGIGSNTDSYECRSFHIYKSKDAVLASGVKLVRHLVIGSGTTIATDTVITNSAIGRNCKIGAHVTMENCYVWDNVTIEDGCVLNNCIICDGVTVYANTTVQQRSILSWNVKVGPDVKLPPDLRLQDIPQKDEFADDEDEEVPDVTPEYGPKSRAFPFNPDSGSDDEGDPFYADWGDVLVSKDKTPEDEDDSDAEHSDESDEGEIVEEDPFESKDVNDNKSMFSLCCAVGVSCLLIFLVARSMLGKDYIPDLAMSLVQPLLDFIKNFVIGDGVKMFSSRLISAADVFVRWLESEANSAISILKPYVIQPLAIMSRSVIDFLSSLQISMPHGACCFHHYVSYFEDRLVLFRDNVAWGCSVLWSWMVVMLGLVEVWAQQVVECVVEVCQGAHLAVMESVNMF